MGLELSRLDVQNAFSLSKQTVLNEQDTRERSTYSKMNFTEFMEFIKQFYKDSWFIVQETS